MKRLLAILMLLAAGFALLAAAADEIQISGAAMKAILERGVLRVGSPGEYNPMANTETDNNRKVGVRRALAEDRAAWVCVEIE